MVRPGGGPAGGRPELAFRAVDSLYNWIVWIHIVGGFTFALAPGVSAGVAFKLREERDVPRVQALLGMYVEIFVLLGAGIAAAFMAGLWGRGWIWTAIAILVLMFVFMYVRASRYFADVRRAAGQPYETGKGAQLAEPPNPGRLGALLADEALLKGFLFGQQTRSPSSHSVRKVNRLSPPTTRSFRGRSH